MAAKLKSVFIDLVGIGGAALVSYGAWLIAQPAGFITGGVFLIAGCVLTSRSAAKE